jgi:hypothetical protein
MSYAEGLSIALFVILVVMQILNRIEVETLKTKWKEKLLEDIVGVLRVADMISKDKVEETKVLLRGPNGIPVYLRKACELARARDPMHAMTLEQFKAQNKAFEELCNTEAKKFASRNQVSPDPRMKPSDVTILSPTAWDELMKIINDPSPPTEALLKAAKKYREEIAAGRLTSTPTSPPDDGVVYKPRALVLCKDCRYGGAAPIEHIDGTCGHPDPKKNGGEIGGVGAGCPHGELPKP